MYAKVIAQFKYNLAFEMCQALFVRNYINNNTFLTFENTTPLVSTRIDAPGAWDRI